MLSVCLYVSAQQVSELRDRAQASTLTPEETRQSTDLHNLLIGPGPAEFPGITRDITTESYIDPLMANQLLDATSFQPLLENINSAAPQVNPDSVPGIPVRLVKLGILTAKKNPSTSQYAITPALQLPEGTGSVLRIEFTDPTRSGTLSFVSDTISRNYQLKSGTPYPNPEFLKAVPVPPVTELVAGLGARQHSETLGITLDMPGLAPVPEFTFARYWLYTYSQKDIPVSVLSWSPYKADVCSPVAAWLETPRQWSSDYRASVNETAAEVRRSPNGLVMISVPAGTSKVVLEYSAPLPVSLAYWLGVASWIGLILVGVNAIAARQLQSD